MDFEWVSLLHNWRLSVKMLLEKLPTSEESIHTIFHGHFDKKKLYAKSVSHLPTVAQKDRWVEASRSFITFTERHDNFLNTIFIGDKS